MVSVNSNGGKRTPGGGVTSTGASVTFVGVDDHGHHQQFPQQQQQQQHPSGFGGMGGPSQGTRSPFQHQSSQLQMLDGFGFGGVGGGGSGGSPQQRGGIVAGSAGVTGGFSGSGASPGDRKEFIGDGDGSPSSGSVDGREFFRKARATLSYDEFTSLLANVKAYNAREQSRHRTLENLSGLLGERHQDLFIQFERLLAR
ncbi:hypothetical protein HDU76_000454 [Blyttiomyces sp. JEL0837]|nr:hypothetical protein HDU76_000454 [Blyttiomyces sp. JEL0837]